MSARRMRVDSLPFISSCWGRSCCLTSRLRTSPMTTFQTWQLGTFLMCWHLGKLLAPADAVCLLVLPDCWAFSKPCGQKMPNMSTVAAVVLYCSHKIMDIKVNMFINASTYKPDTELIEQCGGAYKLQERCFGSFWMLLKK